MIKYKSKNKKSIHKYYITAVKKANNRCKDCNKLISYRNHIRCNPCNRLFFIRIAYQRAKRFLYKNIAFILWFTGFWEDEGSLKLYKRKRNGAIYEGYKISVYQKEVACLYKIKKIFKFGNIYGLGKSNVCSVWSTDNIGEIIALLEFMTPLIKSPRRLNQIKEFLKGSRIKYYKNKL